MLNYLVNKWTTWIKKENNHWQIEQINENKEIGKKHMEILKNTISEIKNVCDTKINPG